MVGIFSALLDPAAQKIDLRFGERFSFAFRRHEIVFVLGGHSKNQFTAFRVARLNSGVSTEIIPGTFFGIESQIAASFFFVGTMAGETFAGKNRSNVAIKIDGLFPESESGKQGQCGGQYEREWQPHSLEENRSIKATCQARIWAGEGLANTAQPVTMKMMKHRILLFIATTVVSMFSASADWPQFLGPDGNSITEANTPLKWSETENVKWKTAIHGKAWSSPVISGNDVWLSTATEDGKKLSVLRLNKDTGKITLDKILFDIADPQFCHKFNSYASPTPVIEAGHIYVTFGSPGTACLDTKTGEVRWQRTDIECNHFRAAGSSPILFQNLLIMNYDGSDHQFVLALNKQTGETVWKVKRSIDYQDLDENGKVKADGDWRKAYGTPHIAIIHGTPVLLSVGAKAIYGYNPENGKEYFRIESRVGHSSSARPAVVGDMVYYTTGWSKGQLWAFKVNPDLSANQDSVELQLGRNIPRKPIQIVHRDRIYTVDDGGVASCLNRLSGEALWRERIGGNYSSTPLLVGDRLYFQNEEGKTTVVAAADEFKVLAENELESGYMASPAVDGNALILRTKTHLYRIEE